MLKLLFQKLQIRPILAPGKAADLLGHLLKITAWGQLEASGPLCSGRKRRPAPQLTANCPRQENSNFFHLILPESQSPHAPCLFPVIKSLAWKEKGRWSVRV